VAAGSVPVADPCGAPTSVVDAAGAVVCTATGGRVQAARMQAASANTSRGRSAARRGRVPLANLTPDLRGLFGVLVVSSPCIISHLPVSYHQQNSRVATVVALPNYRLGVMNVKNLAGQ